MPWLMTAVDSGPKNTLLPLTSFPEFRWAENLNQVKTIDQWAREIENTKADGVIVGTSCSELGAIQESNFRIAATKIGCSTTVIEDYPGNYRHIQSATTQLLLVESDSVKKISKESLGIYAPVIEVGSTLRYDPFRVGMEKARISYKQNLESFQDSCRLMWIGQPETYDALSTLDRLLPDIVRLGAKLIFKAHPRDRGYFNGAYSELLSSDEVDVIDISNLSFEKCIALAPCAVVTQFSSMAVEMGFFGIPSVHVLYPDIGGSRLQDMTGYSTPPLCMAGGSTVIKDMDKQYELLEKVLFDSVYRKSLIEHFDHYFQNSKPVAEGVAAVIDHRAKS